jgi:V-type H+-transporting ATPase subunit B
MKAVVGEDALNTDDKNYLLFLERFEGQFLRQGKYEQRDIFKSLDSAWSMLRLFEQNALTKISKKTLGRYYDRRGAHMMQGAQADGH